MLFSVSFQCSYDTNFKLDERMAFPGSVFWRWIPRLILGGELNAPVFGFPRLGFKKDQGGE